MKEQRTEGYNATDCEHAILIVNYAMWNRVLVTRANHFSSSYGFTPVQLRLG